jgi:hypothetical protein
LFLLMCSITNFIGCSHWSQLIDISFLSLP